MVGSLLAVGMMMRMFNEFNVSNVVKGSVGGFMYTRFVTCCFIGEGLV